MPDSAIIARAEAIGFDRGHPDGSARAAALTDLVVLAGFQALVRHLAADAPVFSALMHGDGAGLAWGWLVALNERLADFVTCGGRCGAIADAVAGAGEWRAMMLGRGAVRPRAPKRPARERADAKDGKAAAAIDDHDRERRRRALEHEPGMAAVLHRHGREAA